MADSKISALTDGGGLKASDEIAIARAGSNFRASPIGVPVLVFRYTVAGSDKASIDTGVDTADAGSNDWTNGDLLEVFIYARTDEAVVLSTLAVTVNNDGSSIYDLERLNLSNTTVSGAPVAAAALWGLSVAGANCAAAVFGVQRLVIPNYAGTVANKFGEATGGVTDPTAANTRNQITTVGYRNTTAISRLAVTPVTAAKKLKVGSQLLIYKRLSS